MNLYDDKDTIIHRLRTHISILEQQQHQSTSTGYFSSEETPTFNQNYSIEKNQYEDAATLEKLLQKREYELDQLRTEFNDFHQEADDKLHRTIEQFNDLEQKYQSIELERTNLRQKLQQLENENDLLKSYMNRLPSEIEYEKLRQDYQILENQLKQSNQTIVDYRKEKVLLKKQLIQQENLLEQQKHTIEKHDLSINKSLCNEKSLTKDERIERDEKYQQFTNLIENLNQKLNDEIKNRKQSQYLNEKNLKIVQSLSNELESKEKNIKDLTNLVRQNRQELSDLRVRLLVSEEEQTRLNERLLSNEQLADALQRVYGTMEKLFVVLEFSSEMLNNESQTSPDVLMLQLSNHKLKSDPNQSTIEIRTKIDLSDIEKPERKLDEIIDRLLSIRSELIARQFENDIQSLPPCRLQ